ncbi:Filament-like plant protein 3 [Heracleum sosnowskyi]|uniref:Filament-like plant protein 3 n=1 Tax=Heracleum sosnowskyi TaxID=360622 RepID=A0AAD8JFT2_9APIA|nr:Filament-like plant protein 3 [Heracleum sosnowskyi]
MDRRSWLWRRKSSDKSLGETESSGSMSSHSERFSDEQAYSNQNIHSPEVASKAIFPNEELDDSVKALREKLASALHNIRAKDDLVKQHSKVAEEAVSGWEKAENEVFSLKQELESLTRKSSSFEDRAIHLDVALKECMRQLRHEREEQEQKIHEAVNNKKIEWESTKSELQEQLVELQSQLQSAKGEAATSLHIDLHSKLKVAENEISSLKRELFSRAEELELRTIERDLSTQAAESASRQNLENVKKVAKLETECRRLKAVARKASSFIDQRSVTESSVYVESFTDSQSDIGERLLLVESNTRKGSELEQNPSDSVLELTKFKNGKNFETPSLDISLMDDFLEMERLVALPDTHNESFHESRSITAQSSVKDITLITDLATMTNRNIELEEKLLKMEMDKYELETSLAKHQDQLETLRDRLKGAETKLVELQAQLSMANEARQAFEGELHGANLKKEVAESQLEVVDNELRTMSSRISSLEEEVQKERSFSEETISNCRKLEEEISRLQHKCELQRVLSPRGNLKQNQDKELAVAAYKFSECQKTIASLVLEHNHFLDSCSLFFPVTIIFEERDRSFKT